MLYLFYREDRDFYQSSDGDTKALARAVDYNARQQALAVEEQYADPAGAFNVQRLDGAGTPWGNVVSACSVLPFLSSHQVVRLSGLIGASSQRRSKSGDDAAKPGISPDGLAALVRALPDTTVLIMEEGALKPTNAHIKALNALDVPKEIRPCAVPQGSERAAWVRTEVARRGGAIEQQASVRLAERLTGSLWAVSSAIDALLSYAGPGERITAAAVETMVRADEDADLFRLTDAIAARNAAQALTTLRRLLAGGMAPEQVMAGLTGRMRDWTLVKACQADRVPDAEAMKLLGWSAGKQRMTAQGARGFGRGELPNAYQALVIADEALKSRPGDERPLILDLLVLTLALRGDPEALRQTFPVPLAG